MHVTHYLLLGLFGGPGTEPPEPDPDPPHQAANGGGSGGGGGGGAGRAGKSARSKAQAGSHAQSHAENRSPLDQDNPAELPPLSSLPSMVRAVIALIASGALEEFD